MKRRALLIFSGILLLTFFCDSAVHAQQTFKTTKASVIAYLEYLPKDYNSNSDKYPVVIFLHGIGERGANTKDINVLRQSVQTVTKWGPPKYVSNGTQFPFILISPQLKNNFGTWSSSYVMEVINYVKTYLRIDEKRIYLTGLSLGGGGAWFTAQDHPELFAALAPVCGGYNTPAKACDLASENLPVWAFHGDQDPIVSFWTSVRMVNAINNCTPAPSPKAIMTIYPGVGHDAWKNAYRTDHTLHNPNVYEWMLSFKNTVNAGNKLPTANAGADKTVSGTRVTITGSASDPDGVISAYQWTLLAGPDGAILKNNTSRSLDVSNLKSGEYMFSFRVTDNGGASDTDYIKLKVDASNEAPIVRAGPDKTIFLPVDLVQLQGTATDADGTIAAFSWTQTSGPTAVLSAATTSTLKVSGLKSGSYRFRLSARDNKGAEGYDDVQVFVKEPAQPVADAGDDITVHLPATSVSITGTATGGGADISSVSWTKRSGPRCTLDGGNTPKLTVSDLVTGKYVFRLTVRNVQGGEAFDEVNVLVDEVAPPVTEEPGPPVADDPAPPLVDAGSDRLVVLPSDTVTLTGMARDGDGTIDSYQWVQTTGATCVMKHAQTASVYVSGLMTGTYTFRLTVSDDTGVTGYDDVSVDVTLPRLVDRNSGQSTRQPPASAITDILSPHNSDYGDGKAILDNLTSRELEDCRVRIFDASGKCLYSGAWTAEKYSEIFSNGGLYIYNVVKEGRRIDAGKIWVRP